MNTNEIQIRLTADIKALQSALAKAQKSLQDFESKNSAETEKSNEAKKRQLGIIEKLNIQAKKLQVSIKQATSKDEIAKFNQELEKTKKQLSFLNSLGTGPSSPVGLINNLNAKIKTLQQSIASATNEKSVARLNAELERTQQELKRIQALGRSVATPVVKSFDNLKRSAGAATGAAIAFSRIIQDAPFGIIGVANNIQSFGEQFAALGGKATTAGQKLSQFFTALIQPANLAILAVSALTAAYQAYSLGLFDAEEETKDLRTESEKLNDSLELIEKNLNSVDSARLKAGKSAANELAEVQLLTSVLNDNSKSEEERLIVYNKLLEKYPKIIGNVSKEKALTEGLGDAYDLLNKSIEERAKIEAISSIFAKLQEERISLLLTENKETSLQNKLLTERDKLRKEEADLLAKVNSENARGATQETVFTKKLREKRIALAGVNEQLSLLGNVSAKATTDALNENSASLTILNEQYGQLDQRLADLSAGEPIKELARSFEDTSFLDFILPLLKEDRRGAFIESYEKAFTSIRSGVTDTAQIFGKSLTEIKAELILFEEALQSVGLTSDQVFQAISNGAGKGFNNLSDFILKLAETQQFFNDAVKALELGIENTIGDVAFAIGEALGNGGNALQAGGAALLGGLAQVLNQLGQMAIAAGITLEAVKKALETLNGPIAVAAGVALIALAGFVSSKSQALAGNFGGGSPSAGVGSTFTNRKEFGGPVSKGRAYIVGERRPELFVPNTNGIIVPQLPSMDYSGASMSASNYGVDIRLKGPDDLLFFVEQAQIRRGLR